MTTSAPPRLHAHRHRTAATRPARAGTRRARPDHASPTAGGQELLTVDELVAELRISRATFYRWRQLGRAPHAIRLPNGGLRISRAAVSDWLETRRDPPGGRP